MRGPSVGPLLHVDGQPRGRRQPQAVFSLDIGAGWWVGRLVGGVVGWLAGWLVMWVDSWIGRRVCCYVAFIFYVCYTHSRMLDIQYQT